MVHEGSADGAADATNFSIGAYDLTSRLARLDAWFSKRATLSMEHAEGTRYGIRAAVATRRKRGPHGEFLTAGSGQADSEDGGGTDAMSASHSIDQAAWEQYSHSHMGPGGYGEDMEVEPHHDYHGHEYRPRHHEHEQEGHQASQGHEEDYEDEDEEDAHPGRRVHHNARKDRLWQDLYPGLTGEELKRARARARAAESRARKKSQRMNGGGNNHSTGQKEVHSTMDVDEPGEDAQEQYHPTAPGVHGGHGQAFVPYQPGQPVPHALPPLASPGIALAAPLLVSGWGQAPLPWHTSVGGRDHTYGQYSHAMASSQYNSAGYEMPMTMPMPVHSMPMPMSMGTMASHGMGQGHGYGYGYADYGQPPQHASPRASGAGGLSSARLSRSAAPSDASVSSASSDREPSAGASGSGSIAGVKTSRIGATGYSCVQKWAPGKWRANVQLPPSFKRGEAQIRLAMPTIELAALAADLLRVGVHGKTVAEQSGRMLTKLNFPDHALVKSALAVAPHTVKPPPTTAFGPWRDALVAAVRATLSDEAEAATASGATASAEGRSGSSAVEDPAPTVSVHHDGEGLGQGAPSASHGHGAPGLPAPFVSYSSPMPLASPGVAFAAAALLGPASSSCKDAAFALGMMPMDTGSHGHGHAAAGSGPAGAHGQGTNQQGSAPAARLPGPIPPPNPDITARFLAAAGRALGKSEEDIRAALAAVRGQAQAQAQAQAARGQGQGAGGASAGSR